MIPEELSREMMREAETEFQQVVDFLFPLRRNKKLTRKAFEKEYRTLSIEQFAPMAGEPLLPLRDSVDRSMMVVALIDVLEKKTFRVNLRNVKVSVPRKLQRVFNRFDKKVEELLLALLDESEASSKLAQEQEEPVKVEPGSVRKLLLQAAFLRLFTAIEVYLEDTLTKALGTAESLVAFSRNLRDNDVPTRWPDGKKIRPVDYALRWNEIVGLILRFPYHEFEGRVSYRFRACFGFELKSFHGLKRLAYFRNLRNRLVHRGSVRLGLPLVEITRKHVLELAHLAYQLADYVEGHKPKIKTAA